MSRLLAFVVGQEISREIHRGLDIDH